MKKNGEGEREGVLGEANRIIHGERREDYGTVEESFARIAKMWEPVFGIPVSPQQVALAMIQLKVARYLNGAQRDSLVDIAGYVGCLAQLDGHAG